VLVTLLLAVASSAPYARAALSPPAGTAFVGFFWFDDDAYNYLSFVQQSESGAVLFHNKLVWEDHPASLVNLEWLAVGWISRALGGRPIVAYRVFGVAALFALVLAADWWLTAAGIPPAHRMAALLLVTTGGGLGGIRFLAGMPAERCLDLTSGAFPVLETLSNPHFVVGTALLLWTLRAAAHAQTGAGIVAAGALGTVLGLTRPYDLVVVVGIRSVVVALSGRARSWWRHAAFVAALAPVVAYNYWAFYLQPAFRFYTDAEYVFPSRADVAWALGPAFALAVPTVASDAWSSALRATPAGRARLHLAVWCAFGAVVFAARPVHFSLQFLVGIGLPLLALAAVTLSRAVPAWSAAAAAAFASTGVVAVWMILRPTLSVYAPVERFALARALRADCRPGDRLVAPGDIGLWAGGLTACRAFTSHGIEPHHAERQEAIRIFYQDGDPAGRAAFLERICATHVVFPASRPAAAWVDARVRLDPVAVAGAPPRTLAAYRIASSCASR
jgi:hypothetical protein